MKSTIQFRSLGKYAIVLLFFLILGVATSSVPAQPSEPIIINHLRTYLSVIPLAWIDSVQAYMKLHYAHTSHGSQLTHGLDVIELADSTYDASTGKRYLPADSNAFCIFIGQEDITYIEPFDYWSTAEGMNKTRSVLNNNPEINVSMFAWCTEISSATEEYVQAYLDSMTVLESEFPNVTFVYMTGNAQSGGAAPNRFARNNQIRQYCIDNNKVLFDFAELDCWWFNPETQEWEYSTFIDYWGDEYPIQHPQFDGDEAGHTTWESCEQKGKALWWMMAVLAGWEDPVAVRNPKRSPIKCALHQNYPNPFNPITRIDFQIRTKSNVILKIYSVLGEEIRTLVSGVKAEGPHSVLWDGKDFRGRPVSSGIYFYRLETGYFFQTRKMVLIR